MSLKTLCPRCGKEAERGDKYCTSCGAALDVVCSLCGQTNSAGARSCESCGAALPGMSTGSKAGGTGRKREPGRYPPLKALQSWKLTLGLGIVLVAALIIERASRTNQVSTMGGTDVHQSGAAQEIRTLQQAVDDNPKDPGPVLRLANAYHDVRLFPKAIAMYERYLELNPSNADARVDLGTSYFELSFQDTTRRKECLAAAEDEVERALTYSPKHQLALFNLGIILFHTGDIDKAIASFRKCITVDSTSDVGRKAMQFVNQHSSMDSSS